MTQAASTKSGLMNFGAYLLILLTPKGRSLNFYTENRQVAIAGTKHSMGGHTIFPGGIILNMLPSNRMELNLLTVQAGA